jgi:hypothetical protein
MASTAAAPATVFLISIYETPLENVGQAGWQLDKTNVKPEVRL